MFNFLISNFSLSFLYNISPFTFSKIVTVMLLRLYPGELKLTPFALVGKTFLVFFLLFIGATLTRSAENYPDCPYFVSLDPKTYFEFFHRKRKDMSRTVLGTTVTICFQKPNLTPQGAPLGGIKSNQIKNINI